MTKHHDHPIPPSDDQPTVPQPATRFAALLRDLRESYFTRVARPQSTNGPVPHLRLSAQALVDCMKRAGYAIAPPTYSLIENGVNLPKDVAGFLTAVRSCLDLSDADFSLLLYLLTHDLVYPRLGNLANDVLRPHSPLSNALSYWRGKHAVTVNELAIGLTEAGFTPVGAAEPEALARHLDRMEQGARWPFDVSAMPAFVSAYARVVGEDAGEAVARALDDEARVSRYIRGTGGASANANHAKQSRK